MALASFSSGFSQSITPFSGGEPSHQAICCVPPTAAPTGCSLLISLGASDGGRHEAITLLPSQRAKLRGVMSLGGSHTARRLAGHCWLCSFSEGSLGGDWEYWWQVFQGEASGRAHSSRRLLSPASLEGWPEILARAGRPNCKNTDSLGPRSDSRPLHLLNEFTDPNSQV